MGAKNDNNIKDAMDTYSLPEDLTSEVKAAEVYHCSLQ